MLADTLSRYWWTTLFRGLLWILFGILTFARPGISLSALIFLFGCFAIADGIAYMAAAIGGRNATEHWWILLLSGLAGVGIGVLTLMSPGITATVLLICIAGWAMATGILEIVASFRLRKEIEGDFWLGLAGFTSVAFGVFLLARPGMGALALLWMIGAYAIVLGVILVVAAFETRGFVKAVRG